ncbi:PQ loop repeat family protein [Aphelenchoides avenae]|nr:PQ loop repeat family protein [Aphelenchus avenae]
MDVARKTFHNALHFVFPKNCFEELLIKFNVFHQECVPMVTSRLLGLAITGGSMFVLIPQILKVFAAKSGVGISLAAQLLALVAAGATSAYSYEKGFVFSQWGDSLFMTLQTMVLIMQILHYGGSTAYAFAFMACCWSLSMAVAYHHVPIGVLTTLQAAVIPIVIASKGIQIAENWRNKSTGQLSLISVSMQFGGCLARVFTSIQETGDELVIASFVIAGLLNGIIFAQIFLYWDNAPQRRKKRD